MFKKFLFGLPIINKKITKYNSPSKGNKFTINHKIIHKLRDRMSATKNEPKLTKINSLNKFSNTPLNFRKKSENMISYLKKRDLNSFETRYKHETNLFTKQNSFLKIHNVIHKYSNDKTPKNNFKNATFQNFNNGIKLPQNKNNNINNNILILNKFTVFKGNNKIKKLKKDNNKLPLEKRRNYIKFIEKKNIINFSPNYNSHFAHSLSTNYMINSISEEQQKKYNRIIKRRLMNAANLLYEKEIRDQVDSPHLEMLKITKTIKKFLTNDSKLNQLSFHEAFYDNFENRINFIFDGNTFPTMKNNLVKLVIDLDSSPILWTRLNYIDSQTMIYLNHLKTKIQREKDEKIEKMGIKINLADVIRKKKKRGSIVTGMDNIIFKDPFIYIENNDVVIKDNEDLYNIEQYFLHKGVVYDVIDFVQPRLKNIFYNNGFFTNENNIEYKKQQEEENIEASKTRIYL